MVKDFAQEKKDWKDSFYGFSFSGSSEYVVGGIPVLLLSLSITFAPFLTIDKNISIGVHLQRMVASFLGGCLLSPFLMQGLSKVIGKRPQNPFYHFEQDGQLHLLNPYEQEKFPHKQFFLYPGCVNNL